MLRIFSLITKPIVLMSLPFVICAGCSRSDGFTGPRGTVEGKIVFQGVPIPEGSSILFMAATQGGYTAGGIVDTNGKYTLKYNGSTALPAVEYLIQISPPAETPDPEMLIDPTLLALTTDEVASFTMIAPPFPPKYSSAHTSQLKFTVEQGKNSADFELEP